MVDQEVQRRRGEIFFLWLSVLSVILGYALTSTASSDHPNDIWFITGVISGFLGSILAFGFVLYISICSEYHYQNTVSNKETNPSEIQEITERGATHHKCLENDSTTRECLGNGKEESRVRECVGNGKKESIARECLGNGKEENKAREYQQNANIEIVPQGQLDIGKWKSVTPEFPGSIAKSSDQFLDDEKMDFSTSPQQLKTVGKTDIELEMLQQAEYLEVQEILSKATKMLQEFSLLAENLEAHRKFSCDTSFD